MICSSCGFSNFQQGLHVGAAEIKVGVASATLVARNTSRISVQVACAVFITFACNCASSAFASSAMWRKTFSWRSAAAISTSLPSISFVFCMDDCTGNALRSTKPNTDRNTRIWERGLTPKWDAQFQPRPVVGTHFYMVAPPMVTQPAPTRAFVPQIQDALEQGKIPDKRRRVCWPNSSPNVDEERAVEIRKWRSIIATAGPDASGLAADLQKLPSEAEQWKLLLAVFHGSAPATLRKHAGSINMFLRWAAGVGVVPLPLQEPTVWNYVSFLHESRAPATRADSFVKACGLAINCLEMPCGSRVIKSKRVDGAVKQGLDRKRITHRASPFSVRAVEAFELAVGDTTVHETKRIIAGFIRFCIGARLRHSDATRVTTEPALDQADGADTARAGHGFIATTGTITKTSNVRGRNKNPIHMVSHACGITNHTWATTWFSLRMEHGRRAEDDGSLMPACGPDWVLVPGTALASDVCSIIMR